jgi:outer membrane lipoprotein-sorting protein
VAWSGETEPPPGDRLGQGAQNLRAGGDAAQPQELTWRRFCLYDELEMRRTGERATKEPMKTKAVMLSLRSRGTRLGALVVAGLLVCIVPESLAAQSITQIIAKVFVARGGLAKVRAIKSERVSGTISFGSEASGPFVVELKRPMKMHMTLSVQNLTMVRVYDGAQGWANNPFAGKMNPDSMTDEDLRNISEEADFDGPLVDYAKKGNKLELAGKDKVEDKDAWRVRLTTKNGDVRYYLFDARTFLLLKWEGKRRAEGKEFPVESYFRDYREVEGLKFSFQIDSGSSATDLTQKLVIDQIALNPEISDSEFAKPVVPDSTATPSASTP